MEEPVGVIRVGPEFLGTKATINELYVGGAEILQALRSHNFAWLILQFSQ